MKYTEAKYGRVFILRLEDGEIIHKTIEDFAASQAIKSAALIILGGIDKDSKLIVGPEKSRTKPVVPVDLVIDDVHEIAGTGTIFPDKTGKPVLHMHISCGRKDQSKTGCIRNGVVVWHVVEVVIFELTDNDAKRLPDSETGFELLTME